MDNLSLFRDKSLNSPNIKGKKGRSAFCINDGVFIVICCLVLILLLLYYKGSILLLMFVYWSSIRLAEPSPAHFIYKKISKKGRYTVAGYTSLASRPYIGTSILCKPFSIQYRLEYSAHRCFLSTKESVLNKALYKYDNPIEQRGQIRKDNDGKPGIYM